MSASQVYKASGLGSALPYIIFVILFGLMTVVPQLMQPGSQAQQKQMSIMMGGMMLFFGWTVSGGVLLYWSTQGLLGLVQQLIQTRVYKAREEQA
jgi:YidC/Oxa1 family membrane protein insertase